MKTLGLSHGIVLIALCALLTGVGCGDDASTDGPSPECESACVLIEAACNSTAADCVEDCQDDLEACPTEMQALLECVEGSVLQCDDDQDQGLAEAPCEAEHAAVGDCGSDPF